MAIRYLHGIAVIGDSTFTGNVMPAAENAHNIGSASVRWEDLYVDDGYIRNAYIDEYVYHNGDTDTNARFQDNRLTLTSGGGAVVDLHSNGNLYFTGDAVFYNTIKLAGSSNEIIKSDGSVRIDIDNNNNQTDRIFIVSKHNSATELFRVNESGNGIFTGSVYATDFVDADNTDYYVDPDWTSVMADIDLDGFISHNGYTSTKFGFSNNHEIKFTTNNTEALKLDSNQVATFGGKIIAGDSGGTSGSVLLQQTYSGDDIISTIGTMYSSGGLILGYGIAPKNGSSGFISTADNANFQRAYMLLDNNEFTIGYAAAQTTTVGSDITGLTTPFTLDITTGDATFGRNIILNGNDDYISFNTSGSGSNPKIKMNSDNSFTFVNTAGSNTLSLSNGGNAVFLGTVRVGDAFTLPSSIGSAGQVLKVPSSGTTLEWGAGGGATVANDANNRITTAVGDGTLNAEANLTFDGSLLTVGGNVTVSSGSGAGDAVLTVEADTGNTAGNENSNPRIELKQDGGVIYGHFGINGDANDTFTGAGANSTYIRAAGGLDIATNGSTKALTIDNSQNASFQSNVNIPSGYVGRDSHNGVYFSTDDSIIYRVADSHRFRMDSTTFRPYTDSTYDLGTASVRWANVYADTLYGDGSNLTNVSGTDNTKLPLTGGTLTGQVIFPSAATTKPVLPNGFISRNDNTDTSGRHDIWGISERYYPSNSTAGDAWGIQWSGTPNDIVFVGGGTDRVTISLDEGNATFAGDVFTPGLYVNATSAVAGTQVAIVKDGNQNLQRWGSSSDGGSQHSYRFRIDQHFKFIGNSGGGDKITIDSATGDIDTDGDITIGGNLTVTGTNTIVNVEDLNVEQNEITLNYGTGDTSATADGAGIRIQDAAGSSGDAVISWDYSDGEFDFSHPINVPGVDYKIATFGTDNHHHYKMTGNSDHTLTLTCGSYYQAEIIITAHQTNGGANNNLYIRGIWSNNHESHHWDEMESIGGLTNSTIDITVSANTTSNSGKLLIEHDYVSGSFAQMVVRVKEYYGTAHEYTIS